MKLPLQIIALTIFLAYLADIRITFSPFSIQVTRGWLVIGIILIMCGCICLKTQWYEEGLKKGAEGKQQEEIKSSL